jgi:type IV conjugative transfer system protein TraL
MKKVNFPQYIDRTRLIFIFELEFFLLAIFSFVFEVWVFSKILNMMISIFLSLYVTYKVLKFYQIAKYEMSPGFIRHVMYRVGLYKPKKDFRKYPELKRRDDPDFYPSGYISEFSD